MNRFFTDNITGDTAVVTGEDVKHIARVLRLQPGDAVSVADGRGTDYTGQILQIEKERVTLRVSDPTPSISEPRTQVTLFQCLPKQGKMETILQKCTELGLYALVPVESRRCVAGLSRDYDRKNERLSRVALEAAKQSRRGRVPSVEKLARLSALDISPFDLFLIPYEEAEGLTLKAALRACPAPARIGVLIGPEGGFERAELAPFAAQGARLVTLGPRILRTETAGMAALAQILYEVEL